jgi:hypothetical protein
VHKPVTRQTVGRSAIPMPRLLIATAVLKGISMTPPVDQRTAVEAQGGGACVPVDLG